MSFRRRRVVPPLVDYIDMRPYIRERKAESIFGHDVLVIEVVRYREVWVIGALEPHRWSDELEALRAKAKASMDALAGPGPAVQPDKTVLIEKPPYGGG